MLPTEIDNMALRGRESGAFGLPKMINQLLSIPTLRVGNKGSMPRIVAKKTFCRHTLRFDLRSQTKRFVLLVESVRIVLRDKVVNAMSWEAKALLRTQTLQLHHAGQQPS